MKTNKFELIQKWHSSGLLSGIEDVLRKEFVAKNLDDAAKWLVKLANESEKRIKHSEIFSGVVLPLVSRISRNHTFDEPIELLLEKTIPIFNFFDGHIIPSDKELRNRIYDLDTRIIDLLESMLVIYLELEQIKFYESQKSSLSENN